MRGLIALIGLGLTVVAALMKDEKIVQTAPTSQPSTDNDQPPSISNDNLGRIGNSVDSVGIEETPNSTVNSGDSDNVENNVDERSG